MNIQRKMLFALFALLTFFSLALLSGMANAQQNMGTVPRIDGFDVEQAKKLVSGTELDFTLYGTPGGMATVEIGGATGRLLLDEVEAGVYEGTYAIKKRDRIVADATVTVNLRVGNQVASAVLDESLLLGSASRSRRAADAAAANVEPRIEHFNVVPASRLSSGNDLSFNLIGSPAAKASVRIAGVKGKMFLVETKEGFYEGTYTIKNKDRIATDAAVTAELLLGNRRTQMVLGKPLLATSTSDSHGRYVIGTCANCGTVEAINVIEVRGEGTYLGKIAGGIAGALLGSQLGNGKGTTVAEIAGAAGGAYAGNEAEKYFKRSKHYEVIVRLHRGGTQTASYPTQPSFKVGDKVKVDAGSLVLDQ